MRWSPSSRLNLWFGTIWVEQESVSSCLCSTGIPQGCMYSSPVSGISKLGALSQLCNCPECQFLLPVKWGLYMTYLIRLSWGLNEIMHGQCLHSTWHTVNTQCQQLLFLLFCCWYHFQRIRTFNKADLCLSSGCDTFINLLKNSEFQFPCFTNGGNDSNMVGCFWNQWDDV